MVKTNEPGYVYILTIQVFVRIGSKSVKVRGL